MHAPRPQVVMVNQVTTRLAGDQPAHLAPALGERRGLAGAAASHAICSGYTAGLSIAKRTQACSSA
jgi:hypothetical protein